jgi:hypothetical protein
MMMKYPVVASAPNPQSSPLLNSSKKRTIPSSLESCTTFIFQKDISSGKIQERDTNQDLKKRKRNVNVLS